MNYDRLIAFLVELRSDLNFLIEKTCTCNKSLPDNLKKYGEMNKKINDLETFIETEIHHKYYG